MLEDPSLINHLEMKEAHSNQNNSEIKETNKAEIFETDPVGKQGHHSDANPSDLITKDNTKAQIDSTHSETKT